MTQGPPVGSYVSALGAYSAIPTTPCRLGTGQQELGFVAPTTSPQPIGPSNPPAPICLQWISCYAPDPLPTTPPSETMIVTFVGWDQALPGLVVPVPVDKSGFACGFVDLRGYVCAGIGWGGWAPSLTAGWASVAGTDFALNFTLAYDLITPLII